MLAICLSFAIVVLDQLTKLKVKSFLAYSGHQEIVPGFFNISHVRNTGAAFGSFSNMSGWLIIPSVGMLVVLLFFRRHILSDSRLSRLILGLMTGGIVGNMIDRIRDGYVMDFLDVYWRGHHFPSFNVADSAITVGVALYMIAQFLETRRSASTPPALESSACASGTTTPLP